MSDDKRIRSPNWLSSENELLLSLVQSHFNIIENKKTDGVTIKSKLAQWKIIADQYNRRTSHCFRTAENLKAKWESLKKVARKDAANNRRHMIQTESEDPLSIPLKKEDTFLQRILCLISTSAGLGNMIEKQKSNRDTRISRRPIHTNTSSLELLRKKKIEAIELQKKLAVEEMERKKVLHDLDTQIKKQILRQEKIKTNLLLIKRRRLLACRNTK
ncbi:uncharacterized protein LOC125061611 [Pieris napi]|uniref:uncharacterized protein LOC125061611 n=1 Tax=Pieris napi TaxID=78633 RepID=UPI001FBC0418|nr:uncharacterized protein LOC125061611 [Pieris napi]